MDKPIERRVMPSELRAVTGPDGDPVKIVGYAAVFGAPSENLGGFREMIRPGAFAKTIQEADIRALFNHNPDYVLGRSKNGTLRLAEDDYGLRIEITPPATAWARDLMTSLERGDIDQMSFGFRTLRDDWQTDGAGGNLRTLIEVALYDVSPVTFPAYPQTEVGLRDLENAIGQLNEAVQNLTTQAAAAPVQADHPAESAEETSAPAASGQLEILRLRLELDTTL